MGSRSAAATAASLRCFLAQVLVCLWVAASASPGPSQSQQLAEVVAKRGSALLQLLESRSTEGNRQAIAHDSGPEEAERTMVALDSNRDKRVDENELSAFADLQGIDSKEAVKAFSGLDSDGDGVLNAAELAAALGSGGGLTGGGAGSESQAAPSPPPQEAGSAGAAGQRSPTSVAGAEAELAAGTEDQSQMATHASKAQAKDPKTAELFLKTLDKNADGHVDEEEIDKFAALKGMDLKKALKAFMSLDANGDHLLNLEELGGVAVAIKSASGKTSSPPSTAPAASAAPAGAPASGAAHAALQKALPAELEQPLEQAVPEHAASTQPEEAALQKALPTELDQPLEQAVPGHVSSTQPVDPALTDELKEQTLNSALPPVDADSQVAASNGAAAPLPDSSTLVAVEPGLEMPMPAGVGMMANNVSSSGNDSEAHLLNAKVRHTEKHALTTVADLLEYARQQESQAEALETRAEELRAEAAMVARKGKEDAEKASSMAVQKKVQELMEAASRLDKEESELTVAAAQLRARSRVMVDQANDYMKAADDALLNATNNATAL